MPNRVGLRRLPSGSPRRMFNGLMFLNVGVQDSKSNMVDANTKMVPHMINNAIVQENG